jgi:hypothetical protein
MHLITVMFSQIPVIDFPSTFVKNILHRPLFKWQRSIQNQFSYPAKQEVNLNFPVF